MSTRERLLAQLNAVKLSFATAEAQTATAAATTTTTAGTAGATTTTTAATATATSSTSSTSSTTLIALTKFEELLFGRGGEEAAEAYGALSDELVQVCENSGDAQVREWLVSTIDRAAIELLLPVNRLVSLSELDVLMRRMSRDTSVRVVCAVVHCATRLFRPLHTLLLRAGYNNNQQQQQQQQQQSQHSLAAAVFAQLQQLRPLIAEKGLVHEHDSVRVRTIKFVEVAALCYSAPDLRHVPSSADSFHLLLVPREHAFLSVDELRDNGVELAHSLLAYVRSATHVSSAAAAVASLAALARQRAASFAVPLVDGLLLLVAEPPPHLTASYIASLRHLVRVLLIALLRRNLDSLADVAHDMLECLANELAVPAATIRQLGAHYGKRVRATTDLGDADRRVRARTAAAHPAGTAMVITSDMHELLNSLPPMHVMPPPLLASLVIEFMVNLPPRPVVAPGALGQAASAAAAAAAAAATGASAASAMVAELDAVEPLGDEECAQLAHDAFGRILSAEASVVRSGSSALRVQLISRLASLKPLDDASVAALLDHVCSEFDQRFELALGWLYNEMHDLSRYEPILHEMLRRVDDGALAAVRLVVASPILPPSVLAHLVDDVALEALYQVCVQRPADAEPALASLLEFAGAADVAVRTEATRIIVSQMLPHEHLAPTIIAYASERFQLAFRAQPTEATAITTDDAVDAAVAADEPTDVAPPVVDAASQIERQTALYFALSAQRPSLLVSVIDSYTSLGEKERRVIHGHLAPLVRQIGQSSDELLKVIDQAATRAPTLAVHILHTLTEREKPEKTLRESVEAAYARTKEARLLVPILAAFDASTVRRLLPAMLMLNKAFIRNMVERLVHRDAPYWSPLSPAELLVALHQIDDDSKSVAGAIIALNAAFESRTTITQEAVAVALQQLVAVRGRKPPLLLLRTVLLALQYYPALARFVCTNVLPPLIQTKIWDDAPRWQGFVKCCVRTLPRSCSVLVQLPTSIFANILEETSDFVRPMVAYARDVRLDEKRIGILTNAAKKLRAGGAGSSSNNNNNNNKSSTTNR